MRSGEVYPALQLLDLEFATSFPPAERNNARVATRYESIHLQAEHQLERHKSG